MESVFHAQDREDPEREDHGLEAAPPDAVEQALHGGAAPLPAAAGGEPRRGRGGRAPRGAAAAAGRLPGERVRGWEAGGVPDGRRWGGGARPRPRPPRFGPGFWHQKTYLAPQCVCMKQHRLKGVIKRSDLSNEPIIK